LERGNLRLQLVTFSNNRQEQLYFLHEALAILEQARIEFEEISIQLYVDLSLQLAKAYMIYFELSQDNKFALITQQILKPLSHLPYGDLFLLGICLNGEKRTALTSIGCVNMLSVPNMIMNFYIHIQPLSRYVRKSGLSN
jgi:hypothetical protein